jgi:transposase
MVFTKEERVELLKNSYITNQQEAIQIFVNNHPDRPGPHRSTVSRTIKRFEETASLLDKPRTGRPKTVSNLETNIDLLAKISVNPTISIRQLAFERGIGYGSTHKNFKS